MDTIKEMDT